MVAWNESHRIRALLTHLRPWFTQLAVVVQDSTDDTAEIANELADIVESDVHHGYGDASFGPKLQKRITTRWTFKIDCDEWPSEDLLASMSSATWAAEQEGHDGLWIPFQSSVDGIEYEEQHGHLRLFESRLSWPPMLHSRPMTEHTLYWPVGHIRHDRTLDELVQDYLRYLEVGSGNAQWTEHNQLMIRSACTGTAAKKGWEYVKSFPWWEDVAPFVES